MAKVQGINVSFNIYDEDTYGQDPGTPDGQRAYLKSCGLKATQALEDDDTLTGSRDMTKPTRGNQDANGPCVMNIGAESIGKWLKHTLGQVATTGTDPYVHTITIGALPVGFMFEKDFGSKIAGTGRVEKFPGCRIGQATFDFPTSGKATASFDVMAAGSSLAAAALDATITDNGHTSFDVTSIAVLQEGGSDIGTVRSHKYVISNDLDVDDYRQGAGGVRGSLDEGQAMVSGELTVVFDSVALWQKAINSTETTLKTTLSRGDGLGSAGNESIEFSSGALVLERTSPEITGPKGILQTFNFKAYGASALQIILKNAVATL